MQSKYSYVYRIIKEKIVFLDLYPGQTIREAALAEELGVSRTPVREALIRLSDEMLVETFPQSGTYVTKIDIDCVRELMTMRHIVEAQILEELCLKKPKVRELLAENMFSFSLATQKRNVIEYQRLDSIFHRTLFSCAGYHYIWDTLRGSHHTRYRALDLATGVNMNESYQQHCDILDCLESGNREKLRTVLAQHHDHTLTRQKLLMDTYPDFFGSLNIKKR